MTVSRCNRLLCLPADDLLALSPQRWSRIFRVLYWCEVMRIVCVLFELTVVFQASECFSPEAVGVPELNELESSSFKDGIRWRKLLTQAARPEILPACLTLSLSSFQGGLTVHSSLFVPCSLIFITLFSSRTHLPMLTLFLPTLFHISSLAFFPHTASSFLLPPPRSSFLGLSELEECGWQVQAWEEEDEEIKGKKVFKKQMWILMLSRFCKHCLANNKHGKWRLLICEKNICNNVRPKFPSVF